jgi:hypothetical protein
VFSFTACTKSRDKLPDNIGETFEFQEQFVADGISLGTVYITGKFNAFTDLIYYKKKWMVVFREGTAHAGGVNGRIKLLISGDGQKWTVKSIYSAPVDLRDPKFLLDSSTNELFITCFGLRYVNGNRVSSNYITKYDDTQSKTRLLPIETDRTDDYNYILWRYTHLKANNFCMAYAFDNNETDSSRRLLLFKSISRIRFKSIVEMKLEGLPSECTIKFLQDTMYLAIRAEYMRAYLGYSLPPYDKFVWLKNKDLPALAAPDFVFYKSTLLLSGRDLGDKKFKLFIYDLATQKVKRTFTFPGGYEVGYSGMCINPSNQDELWLSYYSIEEKGASRIYVAKVNLKVWN